MAGKSFVLRADALSMDPHTLPAEVGQNPSSTILLGYPW